MRIELLPGLTNVVRFPVERRAAPTLDLLRQIAPDVREVLAIAEGAQLDLPPHDLRDLVDEETAARIASHVPVGPRAERETLLAEMIEPLLAAAIRACRDAHDMSLEMVEAQRVLLTAQTEHGHAWVEPLRRHADELTGRTAALLLLAHTRAEEAEGAARAVGIARRREPWTRRDIHADMEAMLAVRQVG